MKIALLQPEIRPGNLSANLTQLKALYEGVEADLAVAPELALSGYAQEVDPSAEEEALEALSAIVIRKRAPLLLGASFREGERRFNAALLLTPEGRRLVATKVNLFPDYDDRTGFIPGLPSRPFTFKGWPIGVIICFDLRFPELVKRLALLGAEVILVLAQWPAVRLAHFKAMLKARAIENQVFVLGVNACGKAREEPLGGESVAFDPQGRELAVFPGSREV
jgi:predicted amidohydrolase